MSIDKINKRNEIFWIFASPFSFSNLHVKKIIQHGSIVNFRNAAVVNGGAGDSHTLVFGLAVVCGFGDGIKLKTDIKMTTVGLVRRSNRAEVVVGLGFSYIKCHAEHSFVLFLMIQIYKIAIEISIGKTHKEFGF